MKKRSILLLAIVSVVLGIAAVVRAVDAPYREGSVWDLTFVRTKAGMSDDYLRSLASTWKKNMDDAKKEGFVVSYRVLSTNAASRDDWDLLLMVEYKNWAAFDGLDAKFRALDAKNVGTEDQQRAVMTKRVEVREILGGKVAQELILK